MWARCGRVSYVTHLIHALTQACHPDAMAGVQRRCIFTIAVDHYPPHIIKKAKTKQSQMQFSMQELSRSLPGLPDPKPYSAGSRCVLRVVWPETRHLKPYAWNTNLQGQGLHEGSGN